MLHKVTQPMMNMPIARNLARFLIKTLKGRDGQKGLFPGSETYWEERYARGGSSGVGSYGKFALFKAEILNGFVAERSIQSVIEFGCGDGNQLCLAKYPRYVGFDVSSTAVSFCQQKFGLDSQKEFRIMGDYKGEQADLALSLDVIYHLIEDDVFTQHVETLFSASTRYVIIYSSDGEDNASYEGTHVKHRKFTTWIRENCLQWKLLQRIENKYPYEGDYREGSFADFFLYEKQPHNPTVLTSGHIGLGSSSAIDVFR
jgi:hypothetical protein